MSKLSSGTRIVGAGDDSAGLAISEKLRGEIRGLNQAARNSQDGVNMIQTAEGALEEVHSMLQRMRELSVQASNDTLDTTDRGFINDELQELKSQIDMVADTTEYNGKTLANGNLSTVLDDTTQFGAGVVLTATANTTVTSVDVSGMNNPTSATKAYDFTYVSATDTLTLTSTADATDNEDVVLTDLNNDSTNTISFARIGLKFDISTITGDTKDVVGAALAHTANERIILAAKTSANEGAVLFQTGADKAQTLAVSFHNVRITDSGGTGSTDSRVTNLKTGLSDFDGAGGKTQVNASNLIEDLDGAIEFISEKRSYYGSKQNRLEHTINNVQQTAENLTASESRIRDVDVAAESANMARANVLQQAAVSVLAQANQAPQLALKLLG
jgi:flagellin